MSYEYQRLDGYKFLCNVFEIISRDKAMKKVFAENAQNVDNTANDDVVEAFLTEKWMPFSDLMSGRTTSQIVEIRKCVLQHFKKTYFWEDEKITGLLEKYQHNLKDTIKVIIRKLRETRDPDVAFGISVILSTAMLESGNQDFYIGEDEAKKILFLCLRYFEYENIEFIPDIRFGERENFRKLFSLTLYHTLLFLFPARKDVREKNYGKGQNGIKGIIQSDGTSGLFMAFQHVAEAKTIAEQLWGSMSSNLQYLNISSTRRLSLAENYLLPSIISNRQTGILTCERGQAIRSLVEGKSGCGKSTLAKLIAFICQNEFSSVEIYRKFARTLDFQRKMWPLIVDCKALRINDIETKSIIECGLDQLLVYAKQAGVQINEQHFKECEQYLVNFCKHKIMQEDFLLIVDDYSKLPTDYINEFNSKLTKLCQNSKLHVVVLSNNLKPSTKLGLSRAFSGLFNEFRLCDIFVSEKSFTSLISGLANGREMDVELDSYAKIYVNTPRRLFQYIQALLRNESIYTVIDSCLEEELNIREEVLHHRDEYSAVIRALTLSALKERKEKERSAGKLTINEKQARRVIGGNKSWQEIWSCIEREAIMIEQCDSINSMEFSTPIYLYSVLSDYYLEILEQSMSDESTGIFNKEFSSLSSIEFANVIALLFHKLYEEEFGDISDYNIEYFMKAIVAKLFEVETTSDLEYCEWGVANILSEDYKAVFMRSGNPERREKMWNSLRRASIAMEICMNEYRDNGLLS